MQFRVYLLPFFRDFRNEGTTSCRVKQVGPRNHPQIPFHRGRGTRVSVTDCSHRPRCSPCCSHGGRLPGRGSPSPSNYTYLLGIEDLDFPLVIVDRSLHLFEQEHSLNWKSPILPDRKGGVLSPGPGPRPTGPPTCVLRSTGTAEGPGES